MVREHRPSYFIVTFLAELEGQPDLRALLAPRPVVYEAPGVRVYDLRGSR
jgi:hypothetical protein